MRMIRDAAATARLAGSHFTGRVWRTDYIEAAPDAVLSGVRFLYEPGARSHWHIHECEQAIIVVYGAGLIAWSGLDQPLRFESGDWWHVEPGVPHWHGAGPDAPFVHLAINAGGATTWLHEVSDAEYRAGS